MFPVGGALAQTDSARELKRLQDERDKGMAAAVEPVKRRYLSALEPLLRRATQMNDLETAIKIREEMQKLGAVAAAAGQQGVAPASFQSRLVNTKWVYWGSETLTFLPGGKARWSEGRDLWTWKVVDAEQRIVEGLHPIKQKTFTMTFEPDLMSGSIQGEGGSRQTRNITRD